MATVDKKKPDFDPDAYLAEPFDPDAYLAEPVEQDKPWYDVSAEGVGKSFQENLPLIGATIGGGVGAALGGVGALPGAAIGATGGELVNQIIQKLQGELPENAATKALLAPLQGAAMEAGGQVAAKGLAGAGQMLSSKLKESAPAIQAAAERLGFKPSPGMLSESRTMQDLESSMIQSPTIAGAGYRKEFYTPGREAVEGATEGVFKDISQMAPSEYGAAAKKSISETIKGRMELPKQIFSDLAESTTNMGLADKSKARVANNIMNMQDIGTHLTGSPAHGEAIKWAKALESAKNVNDLKLLATQANKVAANAQDPLVSAVAGRAAQKFRAAEQSQVLRNSLAAAATQKQGAGVAKEIINDFKLARSLYRSIGEDVAPLKVAKVGNDRDAFYQVLDKLDQVPDEKLAEKLFTTGNRENLLALRERLPEAFEVLRQAKINQVYDKSLVKGEVSLAKFLNNIKSIEPKTRQLIFGDDAAQTIADLQVIQNSYPAMSGPSGTPAGIEVASMFTPSGLLNQGNRALQAAYLRNAPGLGAMTQTPSAQALTQALARELVTGLSNVTSTKQAEKLIAATMQGVPKEVQSEVKMAISQSYPHFKGVLSKIDAPPKERVNQAGEFELRPEDLPNYIEEVMQDQSLNVLDKAMRRTMANKKGRGIADFKPVPVAPPEPPTLAMIAERLG